MQRESSTAVITVETPIFGGKRVYCGVFTNSPDYGGRSGLEGQLLGVTIQHEQPELEKAKSVMLRQEEGFKVI